MEPESMPPTVLHAAEQTEDSSEYKLRKQLLLLAMLVVSVTYVAGLNPPGGIAAGEPILRSTHRRRYLAFYYCNATALATSLVVIFLLLLKHPNKLQLAFLRFVMVVDLFGLMGAYLAGSCREKPGTVYTAALVLSLSAYVGVHILQALSRSQSVGWEWDEAAEEREAVAAALRPKERRKVLLLLATFLAALTYVAGLNPPGGFWNTPGDGGAYRLGDSLVEAHHGGHFRMFFYSNTTAFVACLFIIVLLIGKNSGGGRTSPSFALQVFVLGALLGLLAAYAAGSCRSTDSSVYLVSLFGPVLTFIFLVMVIIICVKRLCGSPPNHSTIQVNNDSVVDDQSDPGIQTTNGQASTSFSQQGNVTITMDKQTEKVRSLVLLLANLVATITYQAGLNPPGGFWPDGRNAGESVLMWTQPVRYKVFFYCNSISFVASLVAIVMVQNTKLVKSRTLLLAMMLDMLALIGAYAAGSCRDVQTSVLVVALAGAVLVYVVIHVVFSTLGTTETDGTLLEKKHKRLLLLAVLVATITYQVGLNPPGGFWTEDDERLVHHAGDAVLLDGYPRRYRAFFYCNTFSFMASIALILLLVNPNLSRLAIRCYSLYVCQVAGLFGILGAYAAGSARSVRTSIFVFVLVAAVVAFFVVHIIVFDFWKKRRESYEAVAPAAVVVVEELPRDASEVKYRNEVYGKRKYLMLLGILVAGVTYEAGLAPPGGVWQDDEHGIQREAGNPVLRDMDLHRYLFFFYSNSTSFVSSVIIITLLLQQILRKHRSENQEWLLLATNTAVVLDVLGLLVAYAAGSTREWENVLALSILVVLLMVAHLGIWMFGERHRCVVVEQPIGTNGSRPPTEEQAANGQEA